MRFVLAFAVVFALALGFAGAAVAQDSKEVTLDGKITCGKCDLGKDKSCTTVIVVTKDGKDTVIYFDAEGHKKYHKDICQGGKSGTVTGTVTEEKGKKTVKVAKLKYAEIK